MKRILIAGANPYNANKGVAALAVSSIKIIYDILSKIPLKPPMRQYRS